jgi:hypothetical protein
MGRGDNKQLSGGNLLFGPRAPRQLSKIDKKHIRDRQKTLVNQKYETKYTEALHALSGSLDFTPLQNLLEADTPRGQITNDRRLLKFAAEEVMEIIFNGGPMSQEEENLYRALIKKSVLRKLPSVKIIGPLRWQLKQSIAVKSISVLLAPLDGETLNLPLAGQDEKFGTHLVANEATALCGAELKGLKGNLNLTPIIFAKVSCDACVRSSSPPITAEHDFDIDSVTARGYFNNQMSLLTRTVAMRLDSEIENMQNADAEALKITRATLLQLFTETKQTDLAKRIKTL